MQIGISLALTQPRGLAIVAPAPNLLVNSKLLGAASGTPGTPPTSWTFGSALGTQTIASLAEGDGNSARISVSANRHTYQETIAAAANTVYVLSVYADTFTTTQLLQVALAANVPAGASTAYRLNGSNSTSGTNVPAGTGHLIECVVTIAATAGSPQWRVGVGCAGAVTGDLMLYRPKLMVGSAFDSYVAT